MACWSTKAAISLKRVKIQEKWVTMKGVQEVMNALSIFWVAAIFLLPVSPLRPLRRPFLSYFCPYSPAISTRWYKWTFQQQTMCILSESGQNCNRKQFYKVHHAVIFAIAQLSCLITYSSILVTDCIILTPIIASCIICNTINNYSLICGTKEENELLWFLIRRPLDFRFWFNDLQFKDICNCQFY